VAYGGGVFVAVNTNYEGRVAYSDNGGQSWTEKKISTGVGWYSVAYGGGAFVAITNSDKTAYSTNGSQSWTEKTLPSSFYWNSIAYGEP
jgi:hypothetical protein